MSSAIFLNLHTITTLPLTYPLWLTVSTSFSTLNTLRGRLLDGVLLDDSLVGLDVLWYFAMESEVASVCEDARASLVKLYKFRESTDMVVKVSLLAKCVDECLSRLAAELASSSPVDRRIEVRTMDVMSCCAEYIVRRSLVYVSVLLRVADVIVGGARILAGWRWFHGCCKGLRDWLVGHFWLLRRSHPEDDSHASKPNCRPTPVGCWKRNRISCKQGTLTPSPRLHMCCQSHSQSVDPCADEEQR